LSVAGCVPDNVKSVDMFILSGTGNLNASYVFAERFNNLYTAYSGETTTLLSNVYAENLYLNSGTLAMANQLLRVYGYYDAPQEYVYGDAAITSTGGEIELRVGGTTNWNNENVDIPNLRMSAIGSGDQTFNMQANLDAGNIFVIGESSDKLIIETNGNSITADNLTLGDASSNPALLNASGGGSISLSNNLNFEEGEFHLYTASLDVDGDAVLESGSTLNLYSSDPEFGSLSTESGSTIQASTSLITSTSEDSSGFAYDFDGALSGNIDINISGDTEPYLDLVPTSGNVRNFYSALETPTDRFWIQGDTTFLGNFEIYEGRFRPYAGGETYTINGNLDIGSNGYVTYTGDSLCLNILGDFVVDGTIGHASWTDKLIVSGDMSGSGTYSHGNQEVEFNGQDSEITSGFDFYNILVTGNLSLESTISYEIMNVTSTGNLSYSTDIGDVGTNYFKQNGGYVSIRDTSLLGSNYSYYNGNALTSNTTDDLHDASYYVDYIQPGSRWLVYESSAPHWIAYARNQTYVYNEQSIMFNSTWQDDTLYGYIFSIKNNITDTWVNSSLQSLSGTEDTAENVTRITEPAGTNISWRFWARDFTGNWNSTPIDSFIVKAPSIAIDLSADLENKVDWQIEKLPADDANATGNNDEGATDYYIDVICEGTRVDIAMQASGDLVFESDSLGLGNETYAYSTSDSTLSGAARQALTTDFDDNQIGNGLLNDSTVYLKFFLDVPGNQAPGNYKNNISFSAVESGSGGFGGTSFGGTSFKGNSFESSSLGSNLITGASFLSNLFDTEKITGYFVRENIQSFSRYFN
jgi:hypothetical protein